MPENIKTYLYTAFGLTIQSEIEIKQLGVSSNNSADVIIEFGMTPSELDKPISKRLLHQSSYNELLFEVEDVARFYVVNGNHITIERFEQATDEQIRIYLLGTVMTAILHQRGFWPIHASAIEFNGKCVLFSGKSGAGKSTMAANFSKRGYPVLSDDVCPVFLNDEGEICVQPAFPHLKLWKDALDRLEINIQNLIPVREELMKYSLPIKNEFSDSPLPVSHLFIISDHNKSEINIKSVKAADKFKTLVDSTHKPGILVGQGNQKKQFMLSTKLAAQSEIYNLEYPMDSKKNDELLNVLERKFRG